MKIKNWKHAIELTIERHQAVLDGKYDDYNKATKAMRQDDWDFDCPLCEYDKRYGEGHACFNCPWSQFEGHLCNSSYYLNDKESIIRLKRWLKEIK